MRAALAFSRVQAFSLASAGSCRGESGCSLWSHRSCRGHRDLFSGGPGSEVFRMLVWLGQRARFCHGQDEIIEILDDEDPEAAKSSEGRTDRVW